MGQYFILLGLFALIFFGMSQQSGASDWRLLLGGFGLLLFGSWVYFRNRPSSQSSERFRMLRRIASRRRK